MTPGAGKMHYLKNQGLCKESLFSPVIVFKTTDYHRLQHCLL